MVPDRPLQVLLTVLFGGSGLFLTFQIIRAAHQHARIDAGTHVLMCVAMIAMVWPWGVDWPVAPQVVIFVLGALWFLAQLWITGPVSAGHAHGTGPFPVVASVYHAVMMIATAWMVVAMPTLMGDSSSVRGPTSMSGMHLSGADLSRYQMSTPGLSRGFAVASGWAFLAILAAASVLLTVIVVRQAVVRLTDPAAAVEPEPAAADPLGGTVPTIDQRTRPAALAVLLSETAMAVGMLAMVVVMLR